MIFLEGEPPMDGRRYLALVLIEPSGAARQVVMELSPEAVAQLGDSVSWDRYFRPAISQLVYMGLPVAPGVAQQ